MSEIAVQNTIEMLCQKFGTTAEYVIPKIQQYKLATTMFGIIASGVFVLIIIVVGIFAYYKAASYSKCETAFCTSLLEMIPVSLLLINIYNHIGWRYAPEVKTIEYLLHMLKG